MPRVDSIHNKCYHVPTHQALASLCAYAWNSSQARTTLLAFASVDIVSEDPAGQGIRIHRDCMTARRQLLIR